MQLKKIDNRTIKITLKELVKLICEYYAAQEPDLHICSQKRLLSRIRLIIAKFALYFKVANLTDIAVHFNHNVSTLSRGLSRMPMPDNAEVKVVRCYIESTIMQAQPHDIFL